LRVLGALFIAPNFMLCEVLLTYCNIKVVGFLDIIDHPDFFKTQLLETGLALSVGHNSVGFT
jgi:hypothetical protein